MKEIGGGRGGKDKIGRLARSVTLVQRREADRALTT